jgi:hypothetical protein
MKTSPLIAGAVLGLALLTSPLLAQSEGGNSAPAASGSGGSGPSGIANSSAGGNQGVNGGQATSGGSHLGGATTNAPSGGEFHPPTTTPGASQN